MTPAITILITQFNDTRITRCLDSVIASIRPGDNVLVADGGSNSIVGALAKRPGVQVVSVPGSVAESRSAILGKITTELVAFVDTDQTITRSWLDTLRRAFAAGEADVAVGRTIPPQSPGRAIPRALNRFEAWYYPHVVAQNLSTMPMGGSVWRTSLIERAGGIDNRFTMGGEDFDLNLRALKLKPQFRYVPDAKIVHDQNDRTSLRGFFARLYNYQVGGALALMKNGGLKAKLAPWRSFNPCLSFCWASLAVKPFALLRALQIYGTWSKQSR